ncbi:MAG TPA: ABC transporter ATP-binding protein [Gemmatimonadales bacterium]|nr:ABC transporter ATP-binding protein [Gemmatimonadales bacterium]
MLRVSGLTRLYDQLVAVEDLSFSVASGEVLGLVGPNGAGKTTTLRSLCGVIRPTRGTIEIGGVDLGRDPVRAKGQIAFMPDEPHLFDYLTVEEHLRFTARLYKAAGAESRIPALLAELELSEKASALPTELSRGMRQKLVIACGLIHDPKALVFDEPLTGLDPAGIRRMKQTIVDRARQGAAVLLSSHLLHLVEEICTRVLILQRGRMVAIGTIPEILAGRPDLQGKSLEDIFLALTGGTG